jgi:RNA polymerase sigma factor (sigma-70 family)
MTEKEFNNCVDSCSDGLYRFLVKNLKDRDTAKNIVQSAFEKMWMKRTEVQSEKARSYLFTTGYRLMVDEWRYQQRFSGLDAAADHYAEEVYAERNDVKRLVDRAAEALVPEQKAVLTLRDFEGYTYEEIAEITGLNMAQVKVYLFRARTHIKKFIGSREEVL